MFDIGGHSFIRRTGLTAQVNALFPDGLGWQPRDARVWFRGELIDYPFQHFGQLGDAAVVAECRDGRPDPALR